ncbi:MAG: sugar phosphate nucleotidyltransferase [Candidatus Thorarchaeota archaeon]
MRCIIPAAGAGTRLRPHTHTKPKALLTLANKPIISHIMDDVLDAGINDFVIIVGYEKEKLIAYVETNYETVCSVKFIEQNKRCGLGHAIYLAGDYLDGDPVLIVLGDSLYEKPFRAMITDFNQYPELVGAITVRSVPDPQNYGIAVTQEGSNLIERLEEKPRNPKSSNAITGVYFIRNSLALKECLKELVKQNQRGTGGELQLTDALQMMITRGFPFGSVDSGQWFDCGRKEALLGAHEYVLNKNRQSSIDSEVDNTIIIPPVAIDSDCQIVNSIIGPYVSIAKGTEVNRGIISSSIVGMFSKLRNVSIHDSVIGDEVRMVGGLSDLNIGDHSSISFYNS